MKKQGIQKRLSVHSYVLYIIKNVNNETFYLSRDGQFYNTNLNAKEYMFENEEERNNFIEKNMNIIIEKYGDVEFKKLTKYICLGYCKKL